MPIASTNPGACNWAEIALRDCSAITTCPTSSVLFTAAWKPKPQRPISTLECAISENPCTAITRSRLSFSDGENAWEYYPGNGRAFLREFYGRIQGDQDFRALTASEAIAAQAKFPPPLGFSPPRDQRKFDV